MRGGAIVEDELQAHTAEDATEDAGAEPGETVAETADDEDLQM